MKKYIYAPLALFALLFCISQNANAQCSYNIDEPNESCSQTSSTWPVSTSTNNIVGCVEPFDRDYYKLSVSGLTFYTQIRGSVFNVTQGNYWLKMWTVGNVLHLETEPWFVSPGADTKIKLYNSSCYSIATNGVNTDYLTYDFTYDLRMANPNGDISMDEIEVSSVSREEILSTFAPELLGDAAVAQFIEADGASRSNFENIYPELAGDVLNIDLTTAQASANISLFDLNGRVLRQVAITNSSQAKMDVSNLATGVYMIRIEGSNGVETRKVALK